MGVSRRIEQITRGTFRVKPGSLFPPLQSMEDAGWLVSEWGESDTKRRAKYYRLTAAGRRQLKDETEEWSRIAVAIGDALPNEPMSRSRNDRDLQREIQSYLELLIEEKIRTGASPDAARRDALVEMGGMTQVAENAREARRGAWLEAIGRDIRCAARTLGRRSLLALVLHDGMRLVAWGVALGVTVSLIGARLLRTQLIELPPVSGWPLGIALGVLVATAFVAALLPALRAARVTPGVVLRGD